MQFYKQTLWSDMFRRQDGKEAVNPKILYSYLAEKALVYTGEMYDSEGKFDAFCIQFMEGIYLDLPKHNVIQLAKELNMSRQGIYDCLDFLRSNELITETELYTLPNLYSMGYFPLLTNTGLRGMDLVLYSYLVYRRNKSSKRMGKTLTEIDVFRRKLAEELNTDESTICKSLSFLEKENWIKRVAKSHNGYVKWWIAFNK